MCGAIWRTHRTESVGIRSPNLLKRHEAKPHVQKACFVCWICFVVCIARSGIPCLWGTCLTIFCWVKTNIGDLCAGGLQDEFSGQGVEKKKKECEYDVFALQAQFLMATMHFVAGEFSFDWRSKLIINLHKPKPLHTITWAEDSNFTHSSPPSAHVTGYLQKGLNHFFGSVSSAFKFNNDALKLFFQTWPLLKHWFSFLFIHPPVRLNGINNTQLPAFITLIIWIVEEGGRKKSIS